MNVTENNRFMFPNEGNEYEHCEPARRRQRLYTFTCRDYVKREQEG